MRLWTLHPKHLDCKGLVALWREGLLAKAVLEGKTRGYRHHPQLIRFRAHKYPHDFLCAYLREVMAEAVLRDYRFDAAKLPPEIKNVQQADESQGQLDFEWQHLLRKLEKRDPELYRKLLCINEPEPHPVFRIIAGEIQPWEKNHG